MRCGGDRQDDDAIPDAAEWDADQGDSIADDLCANLTQDQDGDSAANCQDNDCDGDVTPNFRDDDSDGDGLSDAVEGTGHVDGDDILAYLDPGERARGGPIYLPIILR